MKGKIFLIIYLINKTKILFLIGINILLAYNLYANNDVLTFFEDIKESKLTKRGLVYNIFAEAKEINRINIKKFFILNKEEVMSNYIFYRNGLFKTKGLEIDFKKAYFLEGNFIMKNIQGKYNKKRFKAKKAIFKYSTLELENLYISENGKKYKKLKYILKF